MASKTKALVFVLNKRSETKRLLKAGHYMFHHCILTSESTNICSKRQMDKHQNQRYDYTTKFVCKLDVESNSGVATAASL